MLKKYKEAKVKKEVYNIIKIISNAVGEKIPQKQYPSVMISDKTGPQYVPNLNTIVINAKNLEGKLEKIDSIAEEAGHFVRDYILKKQRGKTQPPSNKPVLPPPYPEKGFAKKMMEYFKKRKELKSDYVQEFFGFLSINLVREKLGLPQTRKGAENYKDFLAKLRKTRKEKKKLKTLMDYFEEKNFSIYKDSEKNEQVIRDFEKYGEKLEKERYNILAHARPYKFASQVDLSKTDLKKLYHLPNEEVIKRFFRGSQKTSKLEKALIGVSLGLVISGILIFNNITGSAIALQELPRKVGSTTMAVGIVLLLLYRIHKVNKSF